MDVYSFERIGVSSTLERAIKEFGRHGLEIIPVDRVGPPDRMRPLLGMGPDDPVICFYMGGRPLKNIPYGQPLVRGFVRELAQLSVQNPELRLHLLNGGGNERTPYEKTGLMGECTLGMAEGGAQVKCVITEGLIGKEGLPKAPGKVICLIDHPGETRLGTRTDVLNGLSSKIYTLFGGFGSSVETLMRLTETSINGKNRGRTLTILNPVVRDWSSGKGPKRRKIRYYDHLIAQAVVQYHHGQVSEAALHNLNNQVVMYNPAEGTSLQDMHADMMSLTFSGLQVDTELYNGEKPTVPASVADRYCHKLSAGSMIAPPFKGFGTNGNWFEALRSRVNPNGKKKASQQRLTPA